MADAPVIVWFRRDLRLADNAALAAAAAGGRPVVPLYVLDEAAGRPPGGAGRWWLHGSLAALDAALAGLGGRLVLRRGASLGAIDAVARETGAREIHFCRDHTPGSADLEAAVARRLEARRHRGLLLFEPEAIATAAGGPYKVFTPFYRACLQRHPPSPQPPAAQVRCHRPLPAGEDLEAWGLRPRKPDWAAGLQETWTPGEAAARARLAAFLRDGIAGYARRRDRPDIDGTSRLSAALHLGELSPRQVWHAATSLVEAGGTAAAGAQAFRRELVWREFCAHLLFHFPDMARSPPRTEFRAFPWRDDPAQLTAWRQGRTGYPIVDAGMRALWHTGWMHNRVRMIVASFLVKDLLIAWEQGEDWFWDTLVDADLASNLVNWQWVAGCGVDAAPFFRIFNPVLQGRRFDPDGSYVRRWLPELAGLPADQVHAPWQAGKLPAGYPAPIVDHGEARRRALAALAEIRP